MIRPHHCPVCEKAFPAAAAPDKSSFPFCSERCRKVDLLRWCDGRYAIVEEIDPQVAQFLSDNAPLTDQGEDSAGDTISG
ncbi:MAG: DNA gyrase inhibitor YacG [Fuerstiella sp.]|nr:DNA gyrase inhibitor YacG [Fuerstiella sp.]MCP4853596.1 DNA gyrase inhibitor YacG [Fuerstiella sp.]